MKTHSPSRDLGWVFRKDCCFGPSFNFTVGIAIYSSEATLNAAYSALKGDLTKEVLAFCNYDSPTGKEERLVTLCFCQAHLSPEIIAHEVFHGMAELIHVLHINIMDDDAQEILAYCCGNLTMEVRRAVVLFRRELKLRQAGKTSKPR